MGTSRPEYITQDEEDRCRACMRSFYAKHGTVSINHIAYKALHMEAGGRLHKWLAGISDEMGFKRLKHHKKRHVVSKQTVWNDEQRSDELLPWFVIVSPDMKIPSLLGKSPKA